MTYMYDIASVAHISNGNKCLTIHDWHEIAITPAGDGKTMNITIDDGVSYATKGGSRVCQKNESILKGRSVAGGGETPEGQGARAQVLCVYCGGAVWSNTAPTLRG